ncbi:MAG: lysylphosphatidylglycerol synthase domain-containing protein [Gaiellaceae bacterium]
MVLLRIFGSRRARIAFNVVSGIVAIVVGVLTAHHFIANGWPLGHAKVLGVVAAGGLFLAAYGFKAWGWSRLFHCDDRPGTLGLAAAGGAASVTGLALPGRTDEVVRISVVRRFPGKRVGMSSIVLSLFLLGLVDNAALAPMAGVAAGISSPTWLIRAGLIVVAVAGVLAAGVVVFLPRIARFCRLERFRFTSWVIEHTATPKDAVRAWALVSVSWVLRATAVFVLLDALSLGASIPLALGFLCASAAAAALPIAPAGAVAQAGAGAGLLAAAGMHASQAAAFAIAAQGMVSLVGAIVLVLSATMHIARTRLRPAAAL